MLQEKFNFSFSTTSLRNFYLKNNVKFGKPNKVYTSAITKKDQLALERRSYAATLASVMKDKLPIIYVDETTFNTWLRPTKVWQFANEAMEIPLNPKRVGQCTLYGAIGWCLSEPVFQISRSTNKEDFVEFLKKVSAKIQSKVKAEQKSHLVYDNHPAHSSIIATEYITQNFISLQMPSYSCQFNSIEWLWSQFKLRFKKMMIQRAFEIENQGQLDALVDQIVTNYPKDQAEHYLKANLPYIGKMLEHN